MDYFKNNENILKKNGANIIINTYDDTLNITRMINKKDLVKMVP